ncbi:iron export ABC transporter permease subunit FetB [Sporolactobacillus shoreae]|uniref:Iron export ABC transporter permease subunit FetB n=1 Tax=Sporolactobacillus shoreae TaxID=1465501 RepID=A0A4Z0GP13_9BACL|nr:iron export ABC transporter permease subunit FetB [Sporolactobacillus shoreae]TGA98120.1 iron export ABC transporter permease subunit FetB [Sporolactobacillus shoreae]
MHSNDLTLWQLASAYVFILILLFIVKVKGIHREKEILISSIRMTIQLIIVGYILAYVFANAHPLFTILILIFMLSFAIYNIYQRAKLPLSPALKKKIALSMAVGVTATLVYFVLVTLSVSPWYNPRYVIPIAGMIIGNTMTGVSLGVNTLLEGMQSKRSLVETALMLGAAPGEASRPIINQAFDSAMLPTINSMVGMGIVFLPGMMTGQIIGGASPLMAIRYQIAVMLGIVGGASLTVLLFVQIGYKAFFNDRYQLKQISTDKNKA